MTPATPFKLTATSPGGAARAGELVTPHGLTPTPAFAPVGSQGTVKTLSPIELETIGAMVILANTYHLMLRPGVDAIARRGGLHRFMGWGKPLITDSGGYQVFSLGGLVQVEEEGARFRSHIDGSLHSLSPEEAVALQEALGADIMMALDQVPVYGASREQVEAATRRTHRWAERCLKAWGRRELALFAIAQGGVYPELRRESAQALAGLDFPGYAIGGLSLGEPRGVTWEMAAVTISGLPQEKPRYLMGVGSPEELVEGVGVGVDLFDSALPTRLGRNGAFFTRRGRHNISNARFREQEAPLEAGCPCYGCRTFSAAYLHHLFKAGELLGLRLLSLHNLVFILGLMAEMRRAILRGSYESFRREFLAGYQSTDEEVRLSRKRRWLEKRGVL